MKATKTSAKAAKAMKEKKAPAMKEKKAAAMKATKAMKEVMAEQPMPPRKINKKSGRDYFIAKNGVTVPSRAWIDLMPSDIVGLTALVAKAAANSIVKDVVQNKSLKGEMKWQN